MFYQICSVLGFTRSIPLLVSYQFPMVSSVLLSVLTWFIKIILLCPLWKFETIIKVIKLMFQLLQAELRLNGCSVLRSFRVIHLFSGFGSLKTLAFKYSVWHLPDECIRFIKRCIDFLLFGKIISKLYNNIRTRTKTCEH